MSRHLNTKMCSCIHSSVTNRPCPRITTNGVSASSNGTWYTAGFGPLVQLLISLLASNTCSFMLAVLALAGQKRALRIFQRLSCVQRSGWVCKIDQEAAKKFHSRWNIRAAMQSKRQHRLSIEGPRPIHPHSGVEYWACTLKFYRSIRNVLEQVLGRATRKLDCLFSFVPSGTSPDISQHLILLVLLPSNAFLRVKRAG
jgi:hypothetical protein